MIEFNGRLSGAAEKRFWNKATVSIQNFMLGASALVLAPIILFCARTRYWSFVWSFLSVFLLIPLMVRIPKRKKERIAMTPKKIYTEDDQIICIADKYAESRYIEDVKCVRDFGEFYELVFPFGKVSEKYICQKDLLTKGTLEEFEALFADKIECCKPRDSK